MGLPWKSSFSYIIKLPFTEEVKLLVVEMRSGTEMNNVQALTKLNPRLIRVASPAFDPPSREKDESSLLKEVIFWSLYYFFVVKYNVWHQ